MAGRMPVASQVRWQATLPQFLALFGALSLGMALAPSVPLGTIDGCAAYLTYSIGSRRILARHHRRGIRLSGYGRFDAAIAAYERSYEFFGRHDWLDRLRSIFLMSASAISYREMALVNIAFCHSQIGQGAAAKAMYERALAEFPSSAMATSALKLIHSAEAAVLASAGVR